MGIREAIDRIDLSEAKDLVSAYFAESDKHPGTYRYTGAYFESFQADQNLTNVITPADLLAVQHLAVTVPARAALGILGEDAAKISELLAAIPADYELGAIPDKERFDELLGKSSAAHQLWDLLRRNDPAKPSWGIGPTIASKIMARKRPHLIPIEDSVVDQVISRGRQNSWALWWEALTLDDNLAEYAASVRDHVGHSELSTLRTLDIVLWKWGTTDPRA